MMWRPAHHWNLGLTDKSILSVYMIVSYLSFVNRIALGLGMEFTPEET